MTGRLLAALCAAGILASPAAADHTTLGIADAHTTVDTVFCTAPLTPPCTFAQTESQAGTFTAPADGRITAWWAASSVVDTGRLRILERVQPLTQVKYQAVVSSEDGKVDKLAPHNSTDLPVKANDLIALATSHVDHEFASQTSDSYETFSDPFADGTSALSSGQSHKSYLEYGAAFAFRPVIAHLDVTAGPIEGGAVVTISGNHLTESTAVRFGTTPAASFTIVSNTAITAKAPAGQAGTVDVTVVGPGGTSATGSFDGFTFRGRSASVAPALLDFGDVPVGKTSGARTITLSNTGQVTVSVASVTLGGANAGDFTTVSDGCGKHDVAGGAACSVTLLFTPSAPGTRRATLRLGDNAADGPHTVVVTGTGVATTTTTAPAATTTTTAAAPVSNATLGVRGLQGRSLTVQLGAPGTVHVADTARIHLLRPSSATGGPGRLVLPLHLTRAAARALARRHHVTVHVRITFTPRSGNPVVQLRSLTLH